MEPQHDVPGEIRGLGLNGKVALVTGAYRGIGLAIAQGLARAGARLVIADKSHAIADRAAEQTSAGYQTHGVQADVTDPLDVARMFDETRDIFGGLDILVNNAAILSSKPAREYTRAEWHRLIETNLSACYFVATEAARLFEAGTGGTIINMSSIVGHRARRNLAPYIAAKAGIDGLTRALTCDLARAGVRVNAIAPGFIESDMSKVDKPGFRESIARAIPAGRWGRPDDIAQVAVFLAGPAATYIHGQTIYVDGGFSAVSP